jgi:hypothetical protein
MGTDTNRRKKRTAARSRARYAPGIYGAGAIMTIIQSIIKGSFLMGLIAFASACVVAEPREGFYDHDHHRYYSGHGWHDCAGHDDVCR